MSQLEELDGLEAQIIVDNELDVMSFVPPEKVIVKRNFAQIGLNSQHTIEVGGETVKELRLESICCAAHGLSVVLVSSKQQVSFISILTSLPDSHKKRS